MMESSPGNIDTKTVQDWYLQLWDDFVEVDKNFRFLKQKRDDLDIKLNVLRTFLDNEGVSTKKLEQTARASAESVKEKAVSPSWTNQVLPMFQLQKQPVHYTRILEVLEDRGYDVPGKDNRNTLLAYLSRHKKLFAKAPELGRGYYKLKE